MKLRTKTWIVVLTALATMVALMLAIGSRTFMQSFGRVEREQVLREVSRVKSLVQTQVDETERIALDYGVWTDSVDFSRGARPEFPEENWNTDSLHNLKVNAMLVFAADGRFVGGVLRRNGTQAMAAPASLVQGFEAEARAVLADRSAVTRVEGLKRVGDDLWVFAGVPQAIPEQPGAPLGVMVVGRLVDVHFERELKSVARLDLELHHPDDPAAATHPGDRTFSATSHDDIRIAEIDDERLIAHLALPDTDGHTVATAHIALDRPIHQQALSTIRLVVIQTAGIALICGVLFHTLLGRAVVTRLEQLHAAVKRIGQNDDLSVRMPARGDDEIAGLGEALNTMLDVLDRGRRDRELANREREALQHQLVQAQKMEALGDFAGGIAHDFNNCLTTITGWLSMVREDMPADSEHRENLGLALASAAHASAVVKQLLIYSRQGEPTLAAVSLGDVLGSSLQLLRSALPKSIQLNLSTTGDDDVVLADSTQLKQVVLNLAKNAADAIDPPGHITLALSAISLPDDNAPGTRGLAAGRYVHLAVHDSGTGIAPQHLDRIFDPFFTTKPAGKGTGLGLAVVRSVVLRHRGGVGVTSRPGEGATFHVYLPLHQEPLPAAEDGATPPPAGCRVLVVDDDPAVLKVVARLVSNLGYIASTATNGQEAWEMFSRADTPYDVVLTDLTMPKLGGLQLGERIFNSPRRAPVVLLSAFASTLDGEQLRRAGFAELLPKPLDSASLRLALARARASRG